MAVALPRTRATVALLAGFAVFTVATVYLVATSLGARSAPEYDPTPVGRARQALAVGDVDTLTIDARDEHAWAFVILAGGAVLSAPDTVGWDLAVRRHHIITTGAIADLGVAAFDSVAQAPRAGYVATRVGRDTSNAAINHWYAYGAVSHLLKPNGHLYVLQTRDGRHFKMEVLSYYCRGLEGGCLTIRFAPMALP